MSQQLANAFETLDLGTMTYEAAWKLQQAYHTELKEGVGPERLLFVQHHPVITLGVDEKWNKLLVPEAEINRRGIGLTKSHRGGGAAYLGSGQLVGYTIMNIRQDGIYTFMRKLEEVMIRSLSIFGITVRRQDAMNPTTDKLYRATWYLGNDRPEVLCTKGIGTTRATNGDLFTHHGFCLNVQKNESYFDLIDPCGFPVSEVRPVSMEEILGFAPEMSEVKQAIEKSYREVFYGQT